MNIDKQKIVKTIIILLLICVGVGILTQVNKRNSITLQDYAEENPELAYRESSEEIAEETGATDEIGTTDEIGAMDETGTTDETNAADKTEDTDEKMGTNESLNSEASTESQTPENTFTSVLTGAQLNGDSVSELRTTYTNYFYYEPLSEKLRDYITGVSFPDVASADTTENDTADDATGRNTVASSEELAISYDDLRYLHVMHYNFDGELVEGELICNKGIAQDLVEIFYELYRNEYQIEKMLLIDEYNGDDTASMEDNNTSCFNYRLVEGSSSLSKHALGLALDINPFYNPYITYNKDGSEKVSPAAAIDYADRSVSFPYKIDENDLCYKLFTEHGFIWGGNWNSCKDYQHFQKVLP